MNQKKSSFLTTVLFPVTATLLYLVGVILVPIPISATGYLLSFVPIFLAGWHLGRRGGMIWGVFIFLMNGIMGSGNAASILLSEYFRQYWYELGIFIAVGFLGGWVKSTYRRLQMDNANLAFKNRKLQTNEQRFQLYVEHMIEGVAIDEVIFKDDRPVDWIIQDINPAYERIMGLSRKQVLGKRASEVYGSAAAIQPYLDDIGQVIRSGVTVHRKTITPVANRAIEYKVAPLGEKTIAIIFYDVTEQERLSLAEKQQRQFLTAARNISATLTKTIQLDEVLDIILESMALFTAYDAANILLINDNTIKIPRYRGEFRFEIEEFPQSLEQLCEQYPAFYQVYQTRKPMVISFQPGQKPSEQPAHIYEQFKWACSYAGLPIIVHDEVIGLLNYLSAAPDFFQSIDIESLAHFAQQTGLAIQNAQAYEDAQKRAHRLGLINDVAAQLTRPASLDEVQQLAVDALAEALNFDQIGLALFNHEKTRLTVVADHPAPGNMTARGNLIPLENNPSMEFILNEKKPFLSEFAQQDPRLISIRHLMKRQNIHSILLIPLIAQGEVIGTMGCDILRQDRILSDDEIQLAETLTSLVAGRIAQARLLELTRKRMTELDMLYRTTLTILRQPYDYSALLETIVENAVWLLDSAAGMLYLKDPNEEYFECKVSYQNDFDPVRTILHPGEGAVGIVANTGQPLIINNYAEWEEKPAIFTSIVDLHTLLSVPVLWQSKVLGVIQVVRAIEGDLFEESDANLLSLFSSQVAYIIENTHLFNEVQRLAILDPLTGLYNRRGLLEVGNREIQRSQRFLRSLSALFVDLDHFKSVNDTYGHAVGDMVLSQVADLCRSSLRGVDIICRLGGDEFVALLPEADLESAMKIAERLRMALDSTTFEVDGHQILFTASIGVAEWHEGITGLEHLIDAADASMYNAKLAGRNTVSSESGVF